MAAVTRRGFLKAAALTVAAPTLARRGPMGPPPLYGDGRHDDTAALQALIDRSRGVVVIPPGTYRISRSLVLDGRHATIMGRGATLAWAGPWDGPVVRMAL